MNKKYILQGVLATMMLASCADEFNPEFIAEKPADLAKMAELADYQPLKEYIDRGAHPTFKLGAALDAAEFNKQLVQYNVGVSNFDEVVAGNAMKYASCVDDKGNMDFGTVNTFVSLADKAGITVYGHTLAWHSQQRPKYLNTLIADKPIPVDPNAQTEKETEINTATYDDGPFPFYVMGCEPPVIDGSIHFVPTGDWSQFFCRPANQLTEGNYRVELKIKSSLEGAVQLTVQNGWGSDAQNVTVRVPLKGTEDFEIVKVDVPNLVGGNYDFILKPETFMATIDLNYVKILKVEMSGPSNVEYKDVWTNELPDPETLKAGDEVANFVVRDANNNDAPAVLVSEGGVNAAKIVGKTNPAEEWDTQFFIYTPNKTWEAGEKYRLTMKYKATKAIGTDTQVHAGPGDYKHWQMLNPNPSFTTDWQEKTWEGTIPSEGAGTQQSIAFNLNKNKADDPGTTITYYIGDVKWESCKQVEVPKVEIVVVDYVNNGDMEGSDANNFCIKENNGAMKYEITDGVGKDGSRGVKVTSNSGAAEDWDTQFWIVLNEALEEGKKVTVKFDYKASVNASADTQAHGAPGDYAHWACVGSPSFTTDWQTYTKELVVDASQASKGGLKSIAFNLSKDRGQDVTYYFDNIRVWSEEEHEIKSTIPLTPEEKHDTLVWAMDKWIAGMMEACEGKVKAWDVVNEAISGDGNDGEGNYVLQNEADLRASLKIKGMTDDAIEKEVANNFFWQDHMGDLEYVRQAVRLARKYYAQSLEEGDDGQLKLFINDYNLESDWDHNKKVKSLIAWIKKWEADGVTKIDGIGTQMHIYYYENPEQLESKKAAIVESFTEMAKSGKLVRISELDMGYIKADGKEATLAEMTSDEQIAAGYPMEKAMEEYYKWIIEKYFEIIPNDKQYGITQWCLTDSPVGSGWRPDTPTGIWDNNWNRKYIYRGWTEALAK